MLQFYNIDKIAEKYFAGVFLKIFSQFLKNFLLRCTKLYENFNKPSELNSLGFTSTFSTGFIELFRSTRMYKLYLVSKSFNTKITLKNWR